MDDTNTPAAPAPRRLRMVTMDEQNEFMRLARALRESGTGDEELQRELGYEDPESLRLALASGRVTVPRLERLRELAVERIGDSVQQRQKETGGRMDELFDRLRGEVSAAAQGSSQAETTKAEAPPADRARTRRQEGRRENRARGRKRQFLTPKQHERLREQVEHLFAVDKRFRNWSLLARVMGLSTGQAAKRAYDVNSSLTTLQNVETFARLHAGFGSRATTALKAGVPVTELQAHLTGGAPAPAAVAEPGRAAREEPARESAIERTSALSAMPEVPPHVDFETMLELGNAVDIEVKRMFHQARFFDGLSKLTTLPSTIRWNAAQTRDRLQQALQFFGGEIVEVPAEEERGEDAGESAAS